MDSMHIIQTAITIDAAPEVVWDILCNGSDYKNWNPFIIELAGELSPGATLTVSMNSPLGGTQEFRPQVIDYLPNSRLCWRGHMLFKGLFDGEHSFQLKPQADGRSVLLHEEQFSGVLAGLFVRRFGDQLSEQFKAMNIALKQRAEAAQFSPALPTTAAAAAA